LVLRVVSAFGNAGISTLRRSKELRVRKDSPI
jgi:hypothetical protein